MSKQELDQPVPVEEYAEERRYVVRLALPGIKPDKDLDVSLDQHVLTIRGGLPSGQTGKQKPEPGYRPFSVRVTLPAQTNDADAAATYRDGILEVSVGWQEGATARQLRVLTLHDPR